MPVPEPEEIEERLVRVFPEDEERGVIAAMVAVMEDKPLTRLFAQQSDRAFKASLQRLLANTTTAPSSSSAAAAAGTNIAGPPYPFKFLVKMKVPEWDVSGTSISTTSSRRLPKERRFTLWDICAERNEIMDFVQQECGDHTDDKPLYTVAEDKKLSSEAMCNTEFAQAFCDPATRMVRKMRPGLRLISSVNPGGAPVEGLPDFVFSSTRPKNQVLVGEGKTPSVMHSSYTIFDVSSSAVKERLHTCVEQEAEYMFRRGRTYGFLTYANGTFFIKRTGDLEFAVTDALKPSCGNPTVMEMLIYVLLKQIDEGEWKLESKALNPRLLAVEGDKKGKEASKQQQHMPPPQTRSKRASGGSTQQTHSQTPKRSKSGCQIEVTRDVIGHGQTGDVLAGRVHNQQVAVKSADLHKQTSLVEMLQHEVVVLKHLAPLQGPTGPVPELVEEGFIEGMDVFFIATGIVSGEHPSSSLRSALPAAQEALAAIHNKGVLHGDIRRDNVLVMKVEDVWKVCFIDFGQSTFSSDLASQAAEMEELQLLFRHSEDGSTNR